MEAECLLPCSQEPPLFPILSQMNLVHSLPPYIPKIYPNTGCGWETGDYKTAIIYPNAVFTKL
jgi:hypothetical protein